MKPVHIHIVPEGTPRMRFSDYACDALRIFPSNKGTKKAIKRGEFTIDGEVASTGTWVLPGQHIGYIATQPAARTGYRIELRAVYEDEYLAVIDKPAGIAVNGNRFKSIENALQNNLNPSNEADALPFPRPVHRLDSPTSGLLIVAKTAGAMTGIGRSFTSGEVIKKYRALVSGRMEGDGTIDAPVEGRHAVTNYSSLKHYRSIRNGWITLLELVPATGRTHQIRIHLAGIGHPILGDTLYGTEGNILLGKGLFLAATGLSFTHPVTGEPVSVEIPMPPKFTTLPEREQRRWEKYR